MRITKKYLQALAHEIIGCAIEVHRHLGPGLLESVYETCFVYELRAKGLKVENQLIVPINYKGIQLNADLRLDMLVEQTIPVENKAVEVWMPIFDAQIMTYMRLLEKPKGLVFNFTCSNLAKQGLKSFVNEYYKS